jgi:hypothetical protein
MDSQNNEYIYYDALISNYNSPNSQIPLIFSDTRSAPLIKNTTGYAMSIIRFTLDTNALPIFIPTMQNGSTTNTVYSITLSYQNVNYQQYMQFIPQNTTSQSATYYHIYNYQYLCQLINNTFSQCLLGLTNACLFAGTPLNESVTAPFIAYDPATQLFTISIDNSYFGTDNNLINIYFNNCLQNLFLFTAYFKSLTNANGLNYMLINSNNVITQEVSSIGNISPILSIVFTSTQLPIIQSVQGNPNIYNNGSIANQNSSNLSYPIITDLVGNNFQFTPNLVYVPSGQYRYISLVPSSKIQNIDFQCYWLDKTGNLNQIYLNTGSSATLKMLFQKMY